MRSRSLVVACLALLALLGALAARPAAAHIVPTGVGTQTWIEVRPRRIVVRFNLGFSSLLGVGELKTADVNQDAVIDAGEVDAYLAALIEKCLPRLRFHLDGKPLELRILGKLAQGMRGPIDRVSFDTFFDLQADVDLGPGPHELTYHEGTYETETSQQILYVTTDRAPDFREFGVEQNPPGPVVDQQSALMLSGRDVTIRFELRPQALERDRAEALLEPFVQGLQGTLDDLATGVARGAEKDLSPLALGEVQLGVAAQGPLLLQQSAGFRVSAPTASDDRGTPATTPPGTAPPLSGIQRAEEDEELDNMIQAWRDPFAFGTLLLFVLWGAVHAKGPGHGKTMVAAYLLGTRGRVWDAVRLGAIVTFTHTFTLYTFGLGLVYLVERLKLTKVSQQQVQNRAIFLLTLLSGIALALYGLGLAWSRKRALDRSRPEPPAPALAPPATGRRLALVAAAPVEAPAHSHGHGHSHEGLDEDAHAALHAREAASGVTSFRDLLTLGLSGGIVPCPAGIALIVLSINIPTQSTLKCFVYLNAFSLGLGSVLVGIAVAMVFSRRFLESSLTEKRRRFLTTLPVYSALFIALLGGAVVYEAFDPNYKSARARLARAWSGEPPPRTSAPAKK